jgi:hypothetical protein
LDTSLVDVDAIGIVPEASAKQYTAREWSDSGCQYNFMIATAEALL